MRPVGRSLAAGALSLRLASGSGTREPLQRRAVVHDIGDADSDDDEGQLPQTKLQLGRIQRQAAESLQVLSARGSGSRPGSRPLSRQGSLSGGGEGGAGGQHAKLLASHRLALVESPAHKEGGAAKAARSQAAGAAHAGAPGTIPARHGPSRLQLGEAAPPPLPPPPPVAGRAGLRRSQSDVATPTRTGAGGGGGGGLRPSWVQELERSRREELARAVEEARAAEAATRAAEAASHASELAALLAQLQAAKAQLAGAEAQRGACGGAAPGARDEDGAGVGRFRSEQQYRAHRAAAAAAPHHAHHLAGAAAEHGGRARSRQASRQLWRAAAAAAALGSPRAAAAEAAGERGGEGQGPPPAPAAADAKPHRRGCWGRAWRTLLGGAQEA
eukprot:scaffold11.g3858.t1